MNWIFIAKETESLTGYRTIEYVEKLPRYEGLRRLEGAEIRRRFKNPFDSSVEIVVIA